MEKTFLKSAVLAITGVGLMAGSAMANLIENGDFETGDLTGWSANGDVYVEYAGTFADVQGMDENYALFGFNSGDNNSTLRQNFDVTGATELTISFDWAFDSWDWNMADDDTFLSFLREDDTNLHRITMQKLKSSQLPGMFGVGFDYGHYEETFSISDAGWLDDEGRVVFRLREGNTDGWAWSVAGIDNVDITSNAPVPEPATMLLFGTGMAGLAGYRRRQAKKKIT